MKETLQRTFTDGKHSVVVVDARYGTNGNHALVELMGDGYVIAFWKRDVKTAEVWRTEPAGGRITSELIEAETLVAALRWGDKLASVLSEADTPTNPDKE